MQPELFHESIESALTFVVAALGGNKKVAGLMRPELNAAAAATWLANCLNDGRPERLNPEQLFLLMRMGREAGIHDAANFAMAETGYEKPVPMTIEDERDALLREVIDSGARFEANIKRMERLAKQFQRRERLARE